MSSVKSINQSLLNSITTEAKNSPRGRKNFNLHQSDEALCHRLLNALDLGSYIQPHRHMNPNKDEALIVVRGKLGAIVFDENGKVTQTLVMEAGGETIGLDTPSGVFHSFVALAPGSVIFEAKAGPYQPLDATEKAAWAPAEGSPEAEAYFDWMRQLFA
jgi:cupin fold WbuC family metalloprotein